MILLVCNISRLKVVVDPINPKNDVPTLQGGLTL